MSHFFHSDFFNGLLGWFLIFLVTLPLAPYLYATHQRRVRHRRGTLAGNIEEGTRELASLVPDITIPFRYLLAKRGSSPLNFTLAGSGDRPFGVCGDQSTGEGLVNLAGLPFRVFLLGCQPRTMKVAINSTVAQDDLLVADANGYAKTLPAAINGTPTTYWIIGSAQQAGTASGATVPTIIEFIGCLPYQLTH